MNFASLPWLHASAFIIPLSALLLFLGYRSYQRRIDRVAHPRVRVYALPFARRERLWIHLPLQLLALACLLLALARPRWDFRWQEVRHKGADIVIALDLSQSMLAADVSPNRLEKAKRAIRDMLAEVQGDRVGLVLFAGVAFIQCPLTFDKGAFELFLEQADVDLIPVKGTAIGPALKLAAHSLTEGAEEQNRGQTVILISDGEDHTADAMAAAKDLAAAGARLYTYGMGGEGAPIPMPDGGFLQDRSGQMVISKPNLSALAELAAQTKGRLLHDARGDSLERLYRSEIRGQGPQSQTSSREKLWQEEHMYLSSFAAIFLIIDSLLRVWSVRRGRLAGR